MRSEGYLQVHQTLHGYGDGHRLLAGSIAVKPADTKLMLALSDLPAPGTKVDETGYLTGYALPETGVYALARTWPAHEMPRPGCVWTHTLLIDYADLALLRAPYRLRDHFRRPKGDFSSFTQPLIVSDGPAESMSNDLSAATRLLFSLYASPGAPVVAALPSDPGVERIVLALWAQQWPRLRRAFRFCTSTTMDRSTETFGFDLQFYPPNERSARTRFVGALDVAEPPSDLPWLEHAILDLRTPETSGLRSFLRNVGGEIDSGRDAFVPLCSLDELLNRKTDRARAIAGAVALAESGSVPWLAAQTAVANAALEQLDSLGREAINFVFTHLEAIEPASAKVQGQQLARKMLASAPEMFGATMNGQGVMAACARDAVRESTVSDLVTAIERNPGLSKSVLGLRMDLLAAPSFWSLSDTALSSALDYLAEHRDVQDSALRALFDSRRVDLAPSIVRRVGAGPVLEAVQRQLEAGRPEADLRSWMTACTRDSYALSRALSSSAVRSRSSLAAIARVTNPDHVPNDYGDDPWWTSLHAAESTPISLGADLYLSAFLLTRALGYRSRSQAELITAAFDTVYSAAAEPNMPEESWQLLSPKLPTSYRWASWDRCVRVRVAVVDAFVDRDLRPGMFGRLTSRDDVFEELLVQAADSYSGRRYLRKVQRELTNLDRRAYSRRLAKIDALLD